MKQIIEKTSNLELVEEIIKHILVFGDDKKMLRKWINSNCPMLDKKDADYICRLIPCVTEGRKIPKDIVRGLVNKASSPLKYDSYFNWLKVLETACGMIKKEKIDNKEECSMALDEKCTRRSYLYGRLLAVAEAAESSTYEGDAKRTTNARRYFEAFSNRPYTTWEIIYNRLNPYLEGMKTGSKIYYEKLINEIIDMFEHEVFNDNSKLEPEYLHAYSCQLVKIYNKNKDIDNSNEEE